VERTEKQGRKVVNDFEIALLAQLVYVSAPHAVGETGTATMHRVCNKVEANAMFSYDIIREESCRLRKQDQWAQDKHLSKITFTNPWISGGSGGGGGGGGGSGGGGGGGGVEDTISHLPEIFEDRGGGDSK